MNMNNPLENLRQLTEAVRMAGADIAPTYIEYVQLAFAIANDCGEAGRNDFLSLCSLSTLLYRAHVCGKSGVVPAVPIVPALWKPALPEIFTPHCPARWNTVPRCISSLSA